MPNDERSVVIENDSNNDLIMNMIIKIMIMIMIPLENTKAKQTFIAYLQHNATASTTIPMDTTVRFGPLKFSLRATIDHHGPSIHSGLYTASINCCKKNIILQRSHNYGVWNY